MTTERTSSDAVIQEPQQQESDLLTDNTTEEQLQTEVEQGLSEGAKENVESGESEVSDQGAETTEVSNNDSTQPQEQEQGSRTYSHDEVSKIQSSYDKRAADNEKTINQLQEQVNQLQESQTHTTQQYSEQQILTAKEKFVYDKEQWLIQQGVDEGQARTQARQEGESAAQTAMAQLKLDQEKQSIEQQKQELDRQARITVTNQIANRYNVPAADLEGFTTPEQMEKYASAVSQTNKVVRETTPQLNTSGDVPPDNIPSNDDDIIDRFASGDPKITMDMYEGAMKRLNPNWHG
tara:strand:+ start:2254 stop:3132 length:879 start_codon:yes stop_codon:yes gene_type:complete